MTYKGLDDSVENLWSEGYSDISICTPDKIGVVIELKYMNDGNLEKGCADALLQIKTRKYDAGLRHKGKK